MQEPKGVYLHDDGRPMLGRKLKGRSKREMAMLGLSVGGPDGKEGQEPRHERESSERLGRGPC